jgi:hypothetical protein
MRESAAKVNRSGKRSSSVDARGRHMRRFVMRMALPPHLDLENQQVFTAR